MFLDFFQPHDQIVIINVEIEALREAYHDGCISFQEYDRSLKTLNEMVSKIVKQAHGTR